jgi:hypothetical protein
MLAQTVVVALLVLGCTVYATWTLLPAGARRPIAKALLKLQLPARLAQVMHKHAEATNACGCEGCDHSSKNRAPPAVQTIRFQPRVRR